MEQTEESDSKSSSVWRYFQKSDVSGYATCIYCKNDFRATDEDTSKLLYHLTKCHSSHARNYKPIRQVVPHKSQNSYKVWSNLRGYLAPKIEKKRKEIYRSPFWRYYTPKSNLGTVECNNCKKELKSASNVSNLKRHYLTCFNRIEKKEGSTNGRSFVWDHFDRHGNNPSPVTCRHCQRMYSNNKSTANLKDHLLRFHRSIMIDMGLVKESELGNMESDLASDDKVNINFPVSRKSSIRKNTSFVWQHFQKTNSKKIATCNYCSKKIIRTCGTTSNLRYHLMKYHRQYIAASSVSNIDNCNQNDQVTVNSGNLMNGYGVLGPVSTETVNFSTSLEGITYDGESVIVNSENQEQNDDDHSDVQENTIIKSKRSFVWRYFTSTSTSDKAVCNYCSRVCNNTGGNTTTLRMHLLKFHADQLQDEDEMFSTDRRPMKQRSLVWEHFEKTENPREVVCLLCNHTYFYIGSTSNMRNHLIRRHPQEFKTMLTKGNDIITAQDEAALAVENMRCETNQLDTDRDVEPTQGSAKSYVWQHFQKTDARRIAVCNYCKKEINTSGNTTNLGNHLWRHHRETMWTSKDVFLDETSGFLLTDHEHMTNVDMSDEENDSEQAKQCKVAPVSKLVPRRTEEDVSTKSAKRGKSLVWNHFRRDARGKKAYCCYCKRKFSTSGTTSSLWKHLTTKHKEIMDLIGSKFVNVFDNEDAEDIQEIEGVYLVDEDPNNACRIKPRSTIWEHFRKRKNSATATCLHCNRTYSCGTTSLLWRHLRRSHGKDAIPDEETVDESGNNDVPLDGESNGEEEESVIWNHFNKKISQHEENDHSTEEENPLEAVTDENQENTVESIVSKHFDRNEEENKAICIYCREEYTEDMQMLLSHLLDKHEELVRSDVKFLLEETKCSESNAKTSETIGNEDIWTHFKRCEEPGQAMCIYCKELCNTSSLRKHLAKDHDLTLLAEDEEGNLSEDPLAFPKIDADKKVGRSYSSYVWKYFKRGADKTKATCIYCAKTYSYSSGTTSNLWRHLLTSHAEHFEDSKPSRPKPPDTVNIYCAKEAKTFEETSLMSHLATYHKVQSTSSEILELAGSDGASVHTTPVWGCFERIVAPQFAVCCYCQLWCEVGEDSSNLRNHLMECHGEHSTGEKTDQTGERSRRESNESYDEDPTTESGTATHRQTDDEGTDVGENFTGSIIPNFVTCKRCGKFCRKDPSVMAGHLEIHQKSEDDTYVKAETDEAADEETTSLAGRKWSIVWNHFNPTTDPDVVLCNHCGKKLKPSGNTTNLRNHLLCCRDLEGTNIGQLKRRPKVPSRGQNVKTKKKSGSSVWRHFRKSNIKHCAICNYCRKFYRSCGNTTNLWDHLVRCHEDVLLDDLNEEEQEEPVESNIKDILKVEPPDMEDEDPTEPHYISDENLKKAAASASVSGLDDYLILVVA